MPKSNVFTNVELMKLEYDRVFSNLKNGTPVPSHIWVMIKHDGVADGEWGPDHLPAFCEHFEKKDKCVNAHMLWCGDAKAGPTPGKKMIIGDKNILDGGTAINLTDLILACTQSVALCAQYHTVITNLIAFPWRYLLQDNVDMVADLHNTLVDLLPDDEEEEGILPHSNVSLQEKEYERVFSALEKGELVPSHWHLYLTFEGDTGGTTWDTARLKLCLKAMLESDDSNVNSVWASEAEHVISEFDRHCVRTERGAEMSVTNKPAYLSSAATINLADFIWLACKHHDIVYSKLALAVLMIVLYPFRHASHGHIDEWLKKTHERLKKVHLATLEHVKH